MNTILSHEPHVAEAGLSPEQAIIYEYLIKSGPQKARDIALKTPFSRPLVYKVLDELAELDLIEKQEEKGSITTYSPKHPQNLADLAERRRAEAEIQYKSTVAAAESLISDFNLMSGKPGVRFFEGVSGIEKVLEDTLTSSEIVYTYVDSDTIDKEVSDIDAGYVQRRTKQGIAKRILMPKTPDAAAYAAEFSSELTDIRLITLPEQRSFYSVLNVYDQKISYITYEDGLYTSMLVSDPSIYTMQRYLFEALWHHSQA